MRKSNESPALGEFRILWGWTSNTQTSSCRYNVCFSLIAKEGFRLVEEVKKGLLEEEIHKERYLGKRRERIL